MGFRAVDPPADKPKFGEWYLAYLCHDHQTFYYVKGYVGWHARTPYRYVDVWHYWHESKEFRRVGCNVVIEESDILGRYPSELPEVICKWYQPTLF